MKKKLLSIISAVLCLCMALSACSTKPTEPTGSGGQKETESQAKSLTMATIAETTQLSPLYMGIQNYTVISLVYETLLKYDDGEVKPNLAEDYSFNEDGTVLTMKLRQGITFHDGAAFNAEAVKKNLDYMHGNPGYASLPGIRDIANVEATDKYTVTITYPHPYYAYAYDFCWPDVCVMQSPSQIVEGDYTTVQGYAGTGPYIYDKYVSGEYTRFERNENYWGETPCFDEIIAKYIPDETSRLQALQTGEVDMIFGNAMLTYQDYQQALSIKGIEGIIAKKDTRARDLTLNASSKKLSDVKVRQAIAYAINKQEISDGLTYGYEKVADMPFPEGTPYADITLNTNYTYDPEKAAALLDEAGWTVEDSGVREKDGETLTLSYIFGSGRDSLASSVATLIKSQLGAIGITVEIHSMEEMEWFSEMMAGNYDITYWNGQYEYASPHCWFTPMSSMSPQMAALSKVTDAQEFFNAITAVTKTDDPAEVQELYNYLINYDLDNAIDVPLTLYKDMIVYNSEKISGYDFGGVPVFFNSMGLQLAQ